MKYLGWILVAVPLGVAVSTGILYGYAMFGWTGILPIAMVISFVVGYFLLLKYHT